MSRGSFILKGSGWYATDYAKKSTPSSTDSDSTSTTEKPATNGTTASSSDSSSKPATESKPAAESKSSSTESKTPRAPNRRRKNRSRQKPPTDRFQQLNQKLALSRGVADPAAFLFESGAPCARWSSIANWNFAATIPTPVASPGESIVRVSLAGICGTDLEIARGYMQYRGVPGHEFAGRVVESQNSRAPRKTRRRRDQRRMRPMRGVLCWPRASLSQSHRARNPRPRRRLRGIPSRSPTST